MNYSYRIYGHIWEEMGTLMRDVDDRCVDMQWIKYAFVKKACYDVVPIYVYDKWPLIIVSTYYWDDEKYCGFQDNFQDRWFLMREYSYMDSFVGWSEVKLVDTVGGMKKAVNAQV
jgi:hypothetical protein